MHNCCTRQTFTKKVFEFFACNHTETYSQFLWPFSDQSANHPVIPAKSFLEVALNGHQRSMLEQHIQDNQLTLLQQSIQNRQMVREWLFLSSNFDTQSVVCDTAIPHCVQSTVVPVCLYPEPCNLAMCHSFTVIDAEIAPLQGFRSATNATQKNNLRRRVNNAQRRRVEALEAKQLKSRNANILHAAKMESTLLCRSTDNADHPEVSNIINVISFLHKL